MTRQLKESHETNVLAAAFDLHGLVVKHTVAPRSHLCASWLSCTLRCVGPAADDSSFTSSLQFNGMQTKANAVNKSK